MSINHVDKALDPSPGGTIARAVRAIWQKISNKQPSEYALHGTALNADVSDTREEAVYSKQSKHLDETLSLVFKGHQEFPQLWIYVHGSWADNSRTEFSDLDDLVIFRLSKFSRNQRDLKKVRSWLNKVDLRFCRLDPLQHHGHWILTDENLGCLDESYMPINVLDNSICIQGPVLLKATIDLARSKHGFVQNIRQNLTTIIALHEKYQKSIINLYEMKCLVGSVLLSPAYLLQVQGHRVTKRWAIEHADLVFKGEALDVIHQCEEIRTNWAEALSGWYFKIFRISPYLFTNPHLYRVFARKMSPTFDRRRFEELMTSGMEDFVKQTETALNAATTSIS